MVFDRARHLPAWPLWRAAGEIVILRANGPEVLSDLPREVIAVTPVA